MMTDRRTLRILPVAELRTPDDLFHCDPFDATMMARSCLRRQDDVHRPKIIGDGARFGSRDHLGKCANCEIGHAVRAQVGDVELVPREQRRTIPPKQKGARKEFATVEVQLLEAKPRALRGAAAVVEAEYIKAERYIEHLEAKLSAMSVDTTLATERAERAEHRIRELEREVEDQRRKTKLNGHAVPNAPSSQVGRVEPVRRPLARIASDVAADFFAVSKQELWTHSSSSAGTARRVAIFAFQSAMLVSNQEAASAFAVDIRVVEAAVQSILPRVGDKLIGRAIDRIVQRLRAEQSA